MRGERGRAGGLLGRETIGSRGEESRPEEERGWAVGLNGREVKGFGVCLFFKTFFKPFSNFNIFKILFKTFQIILKLLKLHTNTLKHHAY
jgi:hypothetical protein